MAVGNCNAPEPRRNTDLIDYFFDSGMGWGRAGAVRTNAENAAINRRFLDSFKKSPEVREKKKGGFLSWLFWFSLLMWFVSSYK